MCPPRTLETAKGAALDRVNNLLHMDFLTSFALVPLVQVCGRGKLSNQNVHICPCGKYSNNLGLPDSTSKGTFFADHFTNQHLEEQLIFC